MERERSILTVSKNIEIFAIIFIRKLNMEVNIMAILKPKDVADLLALAK